MIKSRYSALGMAYKSLNPDEQDRKDQTKAERAQQLVNCECWSKVFFPMLVDLHDKYLEQIKAKTMDIDTLKVFDDIMTLIDGQIQIGAASLRRMAERRLKAAEFKKELNQTA